MIKVRLLANARRLCITFFVVTSVVRFVLRKVGAATLNLGAQEWCIGMPVGAEGAGLTD